MPARKSGRPRRGSAKPRRASQRRYSANAALCLDKRFSRAVSAARQGCNVAMMNEFPYKPEEVVHIKGFASGMWDRTEEVPGTGKTASELGVPAGGNLGVNSQTAQVHNAQSAISKLLSGQARRVLVWDGDALAPDSFTRFIEVRGKTAFKNYILAPFVKEEDLADRIKSWKDSEVFDRITFYVTPNFPNWKALGVAAIMTTGSRSVVCLGGGETVQDELKTMRIIDPDSDYGSGVHFYAFDFWRYIPKKENKKIVEISKKEEGWLTAGSKRLAGPLLHQNEGP